VSRAFCTRAAERDLDEAADYTLEHWLRIGARSISACWSRPATKLSESDLWRAPPC
jgi:plasmid stabilization system protein ParE